MDHSASPPPDCDSGSPLAILAEWRASPKLPIVSTGIAPLDELCQGGLPIPRRVFIVGAPGGSKTGVAVYIGNALEQAGLVVGFLAVDEEREDVLLRLAQIAGLDRSNLLARDGAELDAAVEEFSGSLFRFYECDSTIEDAAADVARRAGDLGVSGVLVVDSIQTVVCKATKGRSVPPREAVEANVAAFRRVTTKHRLLGIATSEANRASYRDGASVQNPMAAGAESRSIEFAAQTQIVMTAETDVPDVFKAQVVKNRALQIGEFALRMDRERHIYTPVDGADLGFERAMKRGAKKNADKAGRERARARKAAVDVARVLAREPGITKNRLYQALKGEHGSYDEKKADAGLLELGDAVERKAGPNNSTAHHLLPEQLAPDVAAALNPEAA